MREFLNSNLVTSNILNQVTHELIGGIWLDENGYTHVVGMVTLEDGTNMPDYPRMEDVYISEVLQIGLKR